MHRLPTCLSALSAAAILAALPMAPPPAQASAGVIRCEQPDGTRVYTSEGCARFGAVSAPVSAELANRILSEWRSEVRLDAEREGRDPALALARMDATTTLASLPPGERRALSAGCARSPRQLAMDLRAAVATGNVNRVAESFDWAGMRNREARKVMDRLDAMSRRAVARADYFDIRSGEADAGVMQVAFHDRGGMAVDDFDVRRDSGCYFLRFA